MSFLVMLLVLMAATAGFGRERFQVNANFMLGYPQSEFKSQLGNTPLGGSFAFLYRLPRSPLLVGTSLAVMVYGYESREEFFSPYIPEVLVDVATTNMMIQAHLLLRFQPLTGPVQPYLDGLLGINHLFTETGVYDRDNCDCEEIADTVHWSDTAPSYGVGAGLMIPIIGFRRGPGLLIELGARFLKGGRAEYLTEGDIRSRGDVLEYYVRESRTDMLTTFLGINFSF